MPVPTFPILLLRVAPWTVVSVLLVTAAVSDLRTRRIPDRITLPACVIGLVLTAVAHGVMPAAEHALGVALFLGVGLAVPGRLLGMGDAKLWAAVAACQGSTMALALVLLTSLVITATQGTRAALASARSAAGRPPAPVPTRVPMAPYALAAWCLLLLGSLVARSALGPSGFA